MKEVFILTILNIETGGLKTIRPENSFEAHNIMIKEIGDFYWRQCSVGYDQSCGRTTDGKYAWSLLQAWV